MKNFKMIAVVGIAALALSACGGGGIDSLEDAYKVLETAETMEEAAEAIDYIMENDPTWAAGEAAEAPAEPVAMQTGETYTYPDGVEVTVHAPKVSSCGMHILEVEIEVVNTTEDVIDTPGVYPTLFDGNGSSIAEDSNWCETGDDIRDGRLQIGASLKELMFFTADTWDDEYGYMAIERYSGGVDVNTVEYDMAGTLP